MTKPFKLFLAVFLLFALVTGAFFYSSVKSENRFLDSAAEQLEPGGFKMINIISE